MKKNLLLFILFSSFTNFIFSQKELEETVSFYQVIPPLNPLEENITSFNVLLTIPYTQTIEEIRKLSLIEFDTKKKNYEELLSKSKLEFQQKEKKYDSEVLKAEERYKMEMNEFKKLSLLERLALSDQGKAPKLRIPSKPYYIQPTEPKYKEPKPNDYLIFDSKVIEDAIKLEGYNREKNSGVTFLLDIKKMEFQDNGDKTYYNQPAILKVKISENTIDEKTFGEESNFLSYKSSNNIHLESYEKSNVNKIIKEVNIYINKKFGKRLTSKNLKIKYPKNKSREYDILVKAKDKAISAYKKLVKEASIDNRDVFTKQLTEVIDIWSNCLDKINYDNEKAIYNFAIAKMLFYNLMTVYINDYKKQEAESVFKKFQDKKIDLKLNRKENTVFSNLETIIYKL